MLLKFTRYLFIIVSLILVLVAHYFQNLSEFQSTTYGTKLGAFSSKAVTSISGRTGEGGEKWYEEVLRREREWEGENDIDVKFWWTVLRAQHASDIQRSGGHTAIGASVLQVWKDKGRGCGHGQIASKSSAGGLQACTGIGRRARHRPSYFQQRPYPSSCG